MRTNIKTYFNFNKSNIKNYDFKSYKYGENKVLITNTYSILKLNEIKDLELNEEDKTLNRLYEQFSDYEDYGSRLNEKIDFNKLNEYDEILEKVIKDKDYSYGINMKMFIKMYKIIKPTKVKILQKWGFNNWNYVYKLENEKTDEIGYLLPTKNYEY